MDSRQREVTNAILFTCGAVLTAMATFIFLFTLFGPMVFAGATVVAGMIGFAAFHYVVWGRSLSEEVAAERPVEEADED